jgi:hypothetical protein
MEVSIGAVLVATIVQFVVGAIWYMPLFGKLWGQMHGFDKLSKAEQKEAQSKMMPLMVTQFVFTILTVYVLAHFMTKLPQYSPYELVKWIWLGFFVPTHVSAVLFGGTDSKWVVKKILVLAFGSLVVLLAGAFTLDWMM